MFLSGVHDKTGLEFANEDAVATLVVGISTSGVRSHLCCTEFALSSVTCEGFPQLTSSQSAQHASVPFHGSAIFHVIERGVLMTHVFC